MKFELSIVTSVALLAGQVVGKNVLGLRRKTKVRVIFYRVFVVVSISF
jgi:hypothetical protein